MFTLALSVQIILTLVCFSAVLVMVLKKPSSYSNVIIIAFLCTFVQNSGYILELLSRNVDAGMMAVKTEYLGGAFEICLITFFMFKYCGHEFKTFLKVILILEGVIVLFSVWTWEITHIYYTGATFVEDAAIPHLVLSHGFMYYAFAVTTVIELIACIFILVVSILKTSQKHMRYNYFILLFVVIVPLIGFILSVVGVLGGFDATPASAAISVGVFAFAIARHHVFDVADAASEIIIRNMDNALLIINSEEGYEYSNERARELFPVLKSYTRGNIIKDSEIKNIFDERHKGQIKLDKRIFDVSINSVKERDVEIGKTAILFDVTDSIHQLDKMKELMSQAEEASRAKSAFLASVSHEIRTPINAIMGLSEVMIRDYQTDETKDYLVNINNSSKVLLNLINDIIDFAKMDSGKMEINAERFDFKRFLSEIVSVYGFRCEQKGLVFEYDIISEIPRYVIGDVSRIRQVFTNVLTNAVKNTEEGVVKLKLNLKYRSDYDIDLIFAVEDNGITVEPKDVSDYGDNLFDDEGTELGLSVTKQLIELMGGISNYKSVPGQGFVFSMVIPIKAVSDGADAADEFIGAINKEKVFKPNFTAPKARILLVDDVKLNLMVTKELLKEIKSEVVTVTSGEQCLDIVEREHFDAIFIDHRMPSMDGIETLSRLKHINHKCEGVPIIMHTANAASDARSFYISKGFTDFLGKPTTAEQLIAMLYKYLPEDLIEKK